MAIVVNSRDLLKYDLNKEEVLWGYCALDCGVTHEVAGVLKPMLDPADTLATYEFNRSMVAPVMAMQKRGLKLDLEKMHDNLYGEGGLIDRITSLGGMRRNDKRKTAKWEVVNEDALLQQLAKEVWGKPLNYHSTVAIKQFLYEHLRLPEQRKVERGEVKVSVGVEALEHLAQNYPSGTMICNIILRLRDLEKLVDVLTKKVGDDGRFYYSLNPVGTETGRMSSKSNVFGLGSNIQNITPELRNIFIADDDMVFFNADLEQSDARGVAYLSGDENYIAACESDDLHTAVASMVFGIPRDRKYADDTIYYRHFSYRKMAKVAGHALNYELTPVSLARKMHITVKQAWRVYLLYLGGELLAQDAAKLDLYNLEHERDGKFWKFEGAFPGIKKWHKDTETELQLNGYLVSPSGMKRTFWGRLNDAATIREGIAFRPQNITAYTINKGIRRLYEEFEPEVQLLGQVHDSVHGQIPKKRVDEYLPRMLECLRNPIQIGERTLTIPVEIKIGKNWLDMEKVKL